MMIRSILAPTDYSENSLKALDYAIYLANELGTELYVLHTFEVPGSSGGHFMNISALVEEERLAELNEVLEELRPKMRDASKLKGLIKEGSAVDTIDHQAKMLKADLIIMGTQGATGLRKILMGSTTAALIDRASIPVLAVPYGVRAYALHHLSFALDAGRLPDTHVLNTALGLGRHFKSIFSVVHMTDDPNDTKQTVDISAQEHFKQFDISVKYHRIFTEDVTEGLMDFSRREQVNLLCVVKQQKSWLERLFFGSTSNQLAMETEVPLLILKA